MRQLATILGFLTLFISGTTCANDGFETEQDFHRRQQLEKLQAVGPGEYKLPLSNSTIKIPETYAALLEDDARAFSELTSAIDDPNIEAVVESDFFPGTTFFKWCDEGYVTLDDWEDMDADALINSISENTENVNKYRKIEGISALHVKGWLQKPTLDRQNKTVFWGTEIEVEGDEQPLLNIVALKLGRKGYIELTWAVDQQDYTPTGNALEMLLESHSFDPGHRYSDYVDGDRVAEFGIAALVAASLGGKLLKGGGLLLLLKKFWGVIAALTMAGYYKVRSYFNSNKGE